MTAENWGLLPPHGRYRDLAALHRSDPAAARALVAAVAPGLAADQRLRMLETLRPALGAGDADLLEDFAADRSSKVQALVRRQLAGLGRMTNGTVDALAEVGDYLKTKRVGLIARGTAVGAVKLKTNAQRARRGDILGRLALDGLAGALDLAADALVEHWDFGDATDVLFNVVAASGTDAQATRFATRALEHGVEVPEAVRDRLDDATRAGFAVRVLADDDWHLPSTRAWLARPVGQLDVTALAGAKHLPELVGRAVAEDKPAEAAKVAAALAFLGHALTRDAVSQLLDNLTKAGLMVVDPRLTLLRLNAAL